MGIKGRRVHMIEELSETIISFQRGKTQNIKHATAYQKQNHFILVSIIIICLRFNYLISFNAVSCF